MKHRILVINPGSTSTKIAVFEGKEKLFDTTLRYSTEELASFGWVMEQVDFRRATIEKALADNNIDPDSLDAICARGGQVPFILALTRSVMSTMRCTKRNFNPGVGSSSLRFMAQKPSVR